MHQKRDLIYGLLWGLLLPVAGFFVLFLLFQLATQVGLMEEMTRSTAEKRLRTISLLAICLNIAPLNMKRKRGVQWIRGIVTSTFVWALIWIVYFKNGLFV